MVFSFSFAHAQFVWDCKSEHGVRDIFAKIWGTDELTVSFGMKCAVVSLVDVVADLSCPDGGTLAFPTPEEADHGKKPWPHVSDRDYLTLVPLLTLVLVGSECLPILASLYPRPAEPGTSPSTVFDGAVDFLLSE